MMMMMMRMMMMMTMIMMMTTKIIIANLLSVPVYNDAGPLLFDELSNLDCSLEDDLEVLR